MGDRVYMRITCRREDAPHFENLGFVEDESESEIAVSMVDDEANCGHSQPLRELAGGGVPFFGWHDAGGEYDASVLASDGAEYAEALCTAQEPRPLAPVNADGSIDTRKSTVLPLYRTRKRPSCGMRRSAISSSDMTLMREINV